MQHSARTGIALKTRAKSAPQGQITQNAILARFSASRAKQLRFPGEVLWYALFRWCCVDRLNRHGKSERSYKKECQEKTFPLGSMPLHFFCLGIQPNWLYVHSYSESGLGRAKGFALSSRVKRRINSSSCGSISLL